MDHNVNAKKTFFMQPDPIADSNNSKNAFITLKITYKEGNYHMKGDLC